MFNLINVCIGTLVYAQLVYVFTQSMLWSSIAVPIAFYAIGRVFDLDFHQNRVLGSSRNESTRK